MQIIFWEDHHATFSRQRKASLWKNPSSIHPNPHPHPHPHPHRYPHPHDHIQTIIVCTTILNPALATRHPFFIHCLHRRSATTICCTTIFTSYSDFGGLGVSVEKSLSSGHPAHCDIEFVGLRVIGGKIQPRGSSSPLCTKISPTRRPCHLHLDQHFFSDEFTMKKIPTNTHRGRKESEKITL